MIRRLPDWEIPAGRQVDASSRYICRERQATEHRAWPASADTGQRTPGIEGTDLAALPLGYSCGLESFPGFAFVRRDWATSLSLMTSSSVNMPTRTAIALKP